MTAKTVTVTITLTEEDVQAYKPKWSAQKASAWLAENGRYIEERVSELGMETLETMLFQEN